MKTQAGLLYFEKQWQKKTDDMVQAMADSARERGNTVVVFNGYTLQETDRFIVFDYIVIFIADKPFFTAQPDPAIFRILKNYDICTRKKCAVFTPRSGLFSAKFIRNAMNAMEENGAVIDYFNTLTSISDAEYAGTYIG